MIDYHTSIPISQSVPRRSRLEKIDTQPLLFSARPKLQELPFLNNLKLVRKLLVALKNQKLRKSLYVVTEGCEVLQKDESEALRHEKAKLSVMDLISEEGKFEQLSNTIKSNLNKNSISPVMHDAKYDEKEKDELNEFDIGQNYEPLKANQSQKQGQNEKFCQDEKMNQKPDRKKKQEQTVLSRKNKLASELNKLGHQLEETYFQVEEMQEIFSTLCNFYSENRKTVDRNLQLKEEKDLLRQKIQQFQSKITDNQRQQILIKDKEQDFLIWYKQNAKKYIQDVIEFNRQVNQINYGLQQKSRKLFSNPQVNQMQSKIEQGCIRQTSSSEERQQSGDKAFQINLKFKLLKSELERIKVDRKNNAQNKNQKKPKVDPNQSNTFSKLYVSELYSL